MASTKKGNAWHFGMKAHVGADTKGRVHSVATTPASVHDAQEMEACLHGQEQVIYGDKAYADQGRKERAGSGGGGHLAGASQGCARQAPYLRGSVVQQKEQSRASKGRTSLWRHQPGHFQHGRPLKRLRSHRLIEQQG